MSLSVNGFIIRKENFKHLDKITELLSLGVKQYYSEVKIKQGIKALRNIFSDKNAILNNSINSNSFYNIYLPDFVMYNKILSEVEEVEVEVIPEQESILSLIKRIEKDFNKMNYSYSLSFLASDSDFLLVELPLYLEHHVFNKEVFKYLENYSVSDQTDTIPSHFNNYKEKQTCLNHWIESHNYPVYFSACVVNELFSFLNLLKAKPTTAFISKVKIAYSVYNKYYLKENERKTDYDIMDEIEDLKETKEFKEHMKTEIQFEEQIINDILKDLQIN